MKLCMPCIGSLLRLTEDWKIDLDLLDLHPNNYSLTHLKQTFPIVKRPEKDYSGKPVEVEYLTGDFIIPKGSLLKITNLNFVSVKEKESKEGKKRPWNYGKKDSISFEIIETSLPYKIDDEVIKTKTGRISKKKPERPGINLHVTPDMAMTVEFEFSV